MTNEEVRAEIHKLDEEIGDWSRIYRQLAEDLQNVDREIMSRHKAKWRLEKLVVEVKHIPASKPRERRERPEVRTISLDDLTPRQLEALLNKMREMQTEGDPE